MLKRKIPYLPTEPVYYPPGTAVKTSEGYFYIQARNARLKITSRQILNSWSFFRIVDTTEEALRVYKVSGKMGFRAGSLIHNMSNGKIYLISENKRCQVMSPAVLTRLGAVGKDVVTVSNEDILLHEEGEPLV